MITCISAIMAASIVPSFIIQPGIALAVLAPIIGIPSPPWPQPARMAGAASSPSAAACNRVRRSTLDGRSSFVIATLPTAVRSRAPAPESGTGAGSRSAMSAG